MYYEPEVKEFNESKNGEISLHLNKINANLGLLVSLLDNFVNIKIRLCEIIKDIYTISNDIKNNTNNFDIRRKQLFDTWITTFDIKRYLPIGAKQACLALSISYELEILLKDLNEDHKEYLYNVCIYLKQVFREINDMKGISVER